MGLFYEVAKGVMKKPRSVAKRVLGRPSGLSEGVRPMTKKRFAAQMPWEDYVDEAEGAARTVERESGYVPIGTRKVRTHGTELQGEQWVGPGEEYVDVPLAKRKPKKEEPYQLGEFRNKVYKGEREALRRDVMNERAAAARNRNRELYPEPVDFRSELKQGGTFGFWEEPQPVKRHLNLTREQRQRFIARKVMSQQQGTGYGREALNPETRQMEMFEEPVANEKAMNVVQGYQPPDVPYARLQEPVLRGGEQAYRNTDMPYVQAIQELLRDAPERGGTGRLRPSDEYIPPASVLSLGENPAFERRVFKSLKQKAKTITQAAKQLPRAPVEGATDVTQEVSQRLVKMGKKAEAYMPLEDVDTDQLAMNAVYMEQLWKNLGGGRSAVGREWERFRGTSRGKHKPKSALDHFISVGVKWMANKEKAKEIYPRETGSLEMIWQEMSKK